MPGGCDGLNLRTFCVLVEQPEGTPALERKQMYLCFMGDLMAIICGFQKSLAGLGLLETLGI